MTTSVAATSQQIVESISPIPKSIAIRTRKRKAQTAEVITSSPFKQRLLEQGKTSEEKKKSGKNKREPVKKGKQKKVAKKRTCREDKRRGRKPKGAGASRKSITQRVAVTQHSRQPRKADDVADGDAACMMCGEEFRHSVPGEFWIQCRKCNGWCHEQCSAGECSGGFVCDFCTADKQKWCPRKIL